MNTQDKIIKTKLGLLELKVAIAKVYNRKNTDIIATIAGDTHFAAQGQADHDRATDFSVIKFTYHWIPLYGHSGLGIYRFQVSIALLREAKIRRYEPGSLPNIITHPSMPVSGREFRGIFSRSLPCCHPQRSECGYGRYHPDRKARIDLSRSWTFFCLLSRFHYHCHCRTTP